MISWALFSLFVVASADSAAVEGPAGLRTHCHQGSAIEYVERKDSVKHRFFPRLHGRYHVGMFEGNALQARILDDESDLLLSEDGRFRKLLQTKGRVLDAKPSAENDFLAVAVTREQSPDSLRPALSSLYLLDTSTWEAEVLVRSLGFAGMAWSPTGHRLAVADFGNLRIYDTQTGNVLEHCLFDNVAIPDGNEWVRNLRWTGESAITLNYQDPKYRYRYQVKLK